MASRGLIAGGVLFALAIAGGFLLVAGTEEADPATTAQRIDPDAQNLSRGAALYAEQCAACHGA
ncbi:MAG: hypothetical protein ACU0CO_13250, partial [Shimia sp.]